ncbi:LOW QUALITY PROTEIN: insulin-like growth factor-binding protein 2 [Myotis lucifugus]|uniref:LOW QUALITY PROTEIN: insulin-like growth factor-binding protein 2 n=1 Tax=Myotis lucifugus TaxID=59463 RepID=UPI000CCC6434|nr:LOW QUALITY PROTEIN: insulin-like growth factor-binding protein 2 [Myotis lucifugus]
MLPKLGGPALPLLLLLPPLLLLLLGAGAHAEVLFRCSPCSPERLAACRTPSAGTGRTCTELVREPGCGCCSVCARLEGETCGVYTPRCAQGLRCYPHPGSELPLQALVRGAGTCEKGRDSDGPEQGAGNAGRSTRWEKPGGQRGAGLVAALQGRTSETMLAEVERGPWPASGTVGRVWDLSFVKSTLAGAHWAGVRSPSFHQLPVWPWGSPFPCMSFFLGSLPGPSLSLFCAHLHPQTPCQQELDQVLERISTMRLPDERGPLEHLYSLHIPNCDKNGLYNLKQCKMAVNGQRGECWCVNPNTGKLLQGSPTVRGDPECHRYYNERMQ